MNKLVRKNKKGFTLTEMIVVIAIIGILAAVLIPSIIGYVKQAQKSAALQEATAVLDVYETWITESEAGLDASNYFINYYKEIVGKDEEGLLDNVYLEFDDSNNRKYAGTAVSLIFVADKVVVEINLETKEVTYNGENPKEVENLSASKYDEIENVMYAYSTVTE